MTRGDGVLRVEGLGKKFCRSLKRSMWYGVVDLARGTLLGVPASRESLRTDEFWSLRDVGFELAAGECLAVMGANGAKSETASSRHLGYAKLAQYLDGATEIQNIVIARELYKKTR